MKIHPASRTVTILTLMMVFLAGPATASEGRAPAPNADGDVLLQVFVYGLAVFEFHHTAMGSLDQVTVHFPPTPDSSPRHHEIEVLASLNKADGLELDPVQPSLIDKSLQMNFPGPLNEHRRGDSLDMDNGFPTCPDAATDVRWLLAAKEIGGDVTLSPPAETRRLIFKAGTVETCALTLDPYLEEACRMSTVRSRDPIVNRTYSEIMVVRQALDIDTNLCDKGGYSLGGSCETRVELEGGSSEICFHCMRLPQGVTVPWKDQEFGYVVDVVIRHVPPTDDTTNFRSMRSDHAIYSERLFPHRQIPGWDVVASDCSPPSHANGEWKCKRNGNSTCRGVQPTCWSHLSRYDGIKKVPESSLNTSACPLHGYP